MVSKPLFCFVFRVKEEVELQQRLAHYNEIQMKKGYVPATSSVPVSSGLSASDFPLAMAAANEISENQGETNGEDLLPPAMPESNFNYDGKISFSEITQVRPIISLSIFSLCDELLS